MTRRATAGILVAMELDRLTDWLLCLRTPVVQAYAVRHGGEGVSLIDTGTEGQADAILAVLADVLGEPVPLRDIV